MDYSWWSTHLENDEEAKNEDLKQQDDSTGPLGDGASTLVPVVSGVFFFSLQENIQPDIQLYDGEGHGDIEMVRIAGPSSSGAPLGMPVA